jgi:hypothetical protein
LRSPRPNETAPPKKSEDEFELDSLVPPTIEPGEPMPPKLPAVTQLDSVEPLPTEQNMELNLTRIQVPGMLAGQSTAVPATISPAVEKVTDTRVVEMAFHSGLSRAVNFDDRSDDDGLYLVLQPKNERGQMVPLAADLSVVVLDPSREGNAARIGRWDYSASDVQAKMQPIGANQGIHLTLPWNGPDPAADRVIVFVRYTFENGRQVIGEKEIFVASDEGLKTVWAPRGSSQRGADSQNQVMQAGYNQEAQPSNVVRPAANSSSNAPAPLPASDAPLRW